MIILIHNEKHFIFLNPNFFYHLSTWEMIWVHWFILCVRRWRWWKKNWIFFVSTMDSILYTIHFIQFNIVWYEWFLSFIFFLTIQLLFLVNLTRPSHRRNRIIYLFSMSSIQFFTFTQQWKKNSLSVSLFFVVKFSLFSFLFFFFLSSC